MPELKFYSNETHVQLPGFRSTRGKRYALTNYGRVISFDKKPEDGVVLKMGKIRGYPCISLPKKDKKVTFLVHRFVAEHFLTKPSSKHRFVLHLNLKKTDNYFQNLKWATDEELKKHGRIHGRATNAKLTEARVRLIKKKMLNGKTRLRIIAKQFGVSDMQIHRIKTGENWGHVKI